MRRLNVDQAGRAFRSQYSPSAGTDGIFTAQASDPFLESPTAMPVAFMTGFIGDIRERYTQRVDA
jgi:hypothetical protein